MEIKMAIKWPLYVTVSQVPKLKTSQLLAFFHDRTLARISLRGGDSYNKKRESSEPMTPLETFYIDYTWTNSWPTGKPKANAMGAIEVKRAWAQSDASSPICVTRWNADRREPLKILAFLSNQIIDTARTTRESKLLLASLHNRLHASNH
jgi:hypothetical protein